MEVFKNFRIDSVYILIRALIIGWIISDFVAALVSGISSDMLDEGLNLSIYYFYGFFALFTTLLLLSERRYSYLVRALILDIFAFFFLKNLLEWMTFIARGDHW